jgi:pyruvate ferredoxin oxidoreductase alpha subunit
MAVGNRALSGPINIHCDHSDSMLVRDSGAIQLFAENAQEAYDLMLMAPRLAEHPDVLLPVLVCQDGFTITHSAEPVVLLDDDAAREFVGDYRIPNPLLDVGRPTTQGPFAMPDYYFELRHQQTAAMQAALAVFEAIAAEFYTLSRRRYHSVEPYALEGADHAIVCIGSTGGTVKDVVDELRGEGEAVGLLELRSFRPLPRHDLHTALVAVPTVSVLDRADSPGGAPPLFADVAAALYGTDVELRSYVYGLGGRDIHPEDIRALYAERGPAYVGLRGAPCLA